MKSPLCGSIHSTVNALFLRCGNSHPSPAACLIFSWAWHCASHFFLPLSFSGGEFCCLEKKSGRTKDGRCRSETGERMQKTRRKKCETGANYQNWTDRLRDHFAQVRIPFELSTSWTRVGQQEKTQLVFRSCFGNRCSSSGSWC